jgi:hypothetical protein
MKKFAFGNIREFDRAKAEETRTVEFIISSAARDRHDSVLNMNGWQLDNFNRNPIVGYQHNVYGGNMCMAANPDDVLGPGRAFIEKDLLIGEVTFETKDINPQAEKIFRKVLNKTLRATSVGFLEIGEGEMKKTLDEKGNVTDQVYHFAGQELLEFSIVNIPSNPEAVGRSLANHTEAALGYLMQFMPEHISMRDVKKMSVQEVLDHVQGKVTEKEVEKVETLKKRLDKRMVIMEHELKLI